jgi:hypothetical protein
MLRHVLSVSTFSEEDASLATLASSPMRPLDEYAARKGSLSSRTQRFGLTRRERSSQKVSDGEDGMKRVVSDRTGWSER